MFSWVLAHTSRFSLRAQVLVEDIGSSMHDGLRLISSYLLVGSGILTKSPATKYWVYVRVLAGDRGLQSYLLLQLPDPEVLGHHLGLQVLDLLPLLVDRLPERERILVLVLLRVAVLLDDTEAGKPGTKIESIS